MLEKTAAPARVEPTVAPSASTQSEKPVATESKTVAERSSPLSSDPKTYYIKATAGGTALSTDDFAIGSSQIWNTKPMPRGTRIAVAVTHRSGHLWPVPGSNTLSFVPASADKYGNLGDVLSASMPLGNEPPKWRLEGPLADGYLFYTLLKDLDRSTYFTAN